MAKPSVVTRVLILAVGVIALLAIGRLLRSAPPKPSTAQEQMAQTKETPNAVPSCGPAVPPGQPQSAAANRHSVTLSWIATAPTSSSPKDAIKGYYVYRSRKSQTYLDDNRISPSPLTGTQCVDATVEARATYFYVVKAVSVNGAESVISKEIKAVIPFP